MNTCYRLACCLVFTACSLLSLQGRELHISPRWTVIVLDEQGHPKAGCKIEQSWSYTAIDEDNSEAQVTDPNGKVVFAPRSTHANPVRLKLAQALGKLPHAGAPEPSAEVALRTEGYKEFQQYYNMASGVLSEKGENAETTFSGTELVTTFRLRPVDIIDVLKSWKDDKYSRAKEMLAKDPAAARLVDILGSTPLFYLYGHDPENAEMAKLLIEAGADVNARDRHGATPLHHAVSQGDPELVELLLKHGADAKAKTTKDSSPWWMPESTPLHLISRIYEPVDRDKIIDLLIQNGADINARDGYGQTPAVRKSTAKGN